MDIGRLTAGRRALVTGASSGFGAHFARLLAANKAGALFLAARRADKLEAAAAACRDLGAARVITLTLDVTDDASIAAAFKVIEAEGGIDILVNNAGIAEQGASIDQPMDAYDRTLDTNLRGVWACAVAAANIMRKRSGGDIVNIASMLGLRVAGGLASYAVSKAGVIQMTKAHAIEWAKFNIRVNAIAPGYFETEINSGFFQTEQGAAMLKRVPMRRIGKLEELDAPFLMLASGASAFLTGAVIAVDGGHSNSSA